MALNYQETGRIVANSYRVNGQAIAGSPDLYATPDTQKWPIGTRLTNDDGRVWRYGYVDTAVNRGCLAAPDFSDSGLADVDNSIVAASAGALSVTVSSASLNVAARVLAGGTLHTTDDNGEGYSYKILDNTVSASNLTAITIADGLQVALTTNTDAAIVPLIWDDLLTATIGTDCLLAGVAMGTSAAGDYGWFQTWGPATVLDDGGTTLGAVCTLSDGTAGAVQDLGGGGTTAADLKTEMIVGYIMIAGDTGGHCVVMLQLWP